MADNENGTTTEVTEVQKTAEKPATVTQPDELVTLRSRNAGLDAKVSSLLEAEKVATAKATAAEAKLAAYEAGKVGGDEALRAQLQVSKDETATARREAALARVEAKYPETFAVLGEDAVNMSAAKLAETEARFRGVPDETDHGRPVGNNPARTQGGASGAQTNPAGETLDQLDARVMSLNPFGRG